MLAKGDSTRLPKKNTHPFHGRMLFEWNLEKLLNLGLKVVLDSDDDDILEHARGMGAISRKRPQELCGHDIPSVPLFLSIINEFPSATKLLNVQANSPQVTTSVIANCLLALNMNAVNEVLTINSDLSLNGSVWGFSRHRLENYGDYYTHDPDVFILDNSIDIHTEFELNNASQEFDPAVRAGELIYSKFSNNGEREG